MIIDEMDLSIVDMLARDGRASARSLSRLLPISEGTARLRLRRLLESKLKVKALVNPTKAGFPLTAVLGFRAALPGLDGLVRKLALHPRVNHIAQVTGGLDIIALCMFRSPQDMGAVIEEFGSSFPGIKEIEVSICLLTPLGHFATVNSGWLLEGGRVRPGEHDIDAAIIGLLGEDGRLTARQIADRVSSNEIRIRRHLRELLKTGVITVRALVSPDRIGFPVVAICGLKVEPTKARQVASKIAGHRQVNYVTTCAGNFDVFFVGMFRSNRELSVVLQEFVSRLEGVNKTHTFMCIADEQGYVSLFVPRCLGKPSPVRLTGEPDVSA